MKSNIATNQKFTIDANIKPIHSQSVNTEIINCIAQSKALNFPTQGIEVAANDCRNNKLNQTLPDNSKNISGYMIDLVALMLIIIIPIIPFLKFLN